MELLYLITFGIGIYLLIIWRNESKRKNKILFHQNEWGSEICKTLICKKISIGMTEEMVLLSWGHPSKKETKEITANHKKTRWIYGTPRKNADYVWFKNGEVWKIKS